MTKAEEVAALRAVLFMEHMGGSCPLDYPEWRRREALRKRRLLRFEGRRRVRWDRTFYQITEAGRMAIVDFELKKGAA